MFFEELNAGNTCAFFIFYWKMPVDKINKNKHRFVWIKCNIHMEDNIYNIKQISRPILPPIQQGQPALAFFWPSNTINYLVGEREQKNEKKKH